MCDASDGSAGRYHTSQALGPLSRARNALPTSPSLNNCGTFSSTADTAHVLNGNARAAVAAPRRRIQRQSPGAPVGQGARSPAVRLSQSHLARATGLGTLSAEKREARKHAFPSARPEVSDPPRRVAQSPQTADPDCGHGSQTPN